MKLLSIETTGPISSVAIYEDGIITEIKNEDSYSHLQNLMPEVDAILKEENINPKDLDAIAVSQGPGSFTGIRIGMVSAKGLAQVWDKPIVEVPTLCSYAYKDYDWYEGENILFCPVLDAKMHQVYAAAYKKDCLNPVIQPLAYQLEDFLKLLEKESKNYDGIVFFGDAISVYQEKFDEFEPLHAIAPKEDWYPTASSVAWLGSELFEKGITKTCYTAQPEYLRLPEAERKFKTKKLDLRLARVDETDRVLQIEKDSFDDPWSREIFLDEIQKSLLCEKVEDPYLYSKFIVAADNKAEGFVIADFIKDDFAEILDIATSKDRRREGIARKMLLYVIELAKKDNIKTIQLEVRKSNTPAICLYESLGFKSVGERKNYYADGETAILMDKDI